MSYITTVLDHFDRLKRYARNLTSTKKSERRSWEAPLAAELVEDLPQLASRLQRIPEMFFEACQMVRSLLSTMMWQFMDGIRMATSISGPNEPVSNQDELSLTNMRLKKLLEYTQSRLAEAREQLDDNDKKVEEDHQTAIKREVVHRIKDYLRVQFANAKLEDMYTFCRQSGVGATILERIAAAFPTTKNAMIGRKEKEWSAMNAAFGRFLDAATKMETVGVSRADDDDCATMLAEDINELAENDASLHGLVSVLQALVAALRPGVKVNYDGQIVSDYEQEVFGMRPLADYPLQVVTAEATKAIEEHLKKIAVERQKNRAV